MSLITVLPLAIVMVAGPQILSAIFLATSEEWRKNSSAFVIGAIISISLMTTVGYLLGSSLSGSSTGFGPTLSFAILLLILYAMFDTYRKRNVSEPPKWMGKLEKANPRFSFKLGFLLLGFFPSDIATSFAVGSYLSSQAAPLTNSAGFIGLTALLLATPSLIIIIFGERAEKLLPKVRDWMNQNSWIINEAVLVLFLALTLNNLF